MSWAKTLPAGRAHAHPEPISGAAFSAVELMPGDRAVMLLDQRKLPSAERYEHLTEWGQVEDAIKTMMVRGAPAIGVAAAYALVLASSRGPEALRAAAESLRNARPTAVNLSHAIAAMMRAAETDPSTKNLAEVARAYHASDVAA
ncbi:MAG TPA: S-methyl-5-thioribose-1-phosphate isomerase, partial [Polyangiaceae bacterium]